MPYGHDELQVALRAPDSEPGQIPFDFSALRALGPDADEGDETIYDLYMYFKLYYIFYKYYHYYYFPDDLFDFVALGYEPRREREEERGREMEEMSYLNQKITDTV
eukprot:14713413-Heterocapsa_arctica.AAC.1